jgi:cation transport regulator ChaB
MPVRSKQDLPSTLQRSDSRAQEIWAKAHDRAIESYGEGERAHRTAYAALKHSYEKIGDHWERKSRRGPSDPQAARRRPDSRRARPTAEGVDANASKAHLMDVARRLDVRGRSRMSKRELVEEIKKANRRATAKSRRG